MALFQRLFPLCMRGALRIAASLFVASLSASAVAAALSFPFSVSQPPGAQVTDTVSGTTLTVSGGDGFTTLIATVDQSTLPPGPSTTNLSGLVASLAGPLTSIRLDIGGGTFDLTGLTLYAAPTDSNNNLLTLTTSKGSVNVTFTSTSGTADVHALSDTTLQGVTYVDISRQDAGIITIALDDVNLNVPGTTGGGACSAAYTQTGFTIGNCGSNTASGTSCTASCASGYTGTPTGAVSCSSGSYTGTFSGCTPSACSSAYTQTGFTIGNCGSNTASGTSCTASCASGYTGTPTGAVSCSSGSYTGTFSGCTPSACSSAYTQTGFTIGNCGSNTASGTSCTASCASGYTGTPTGAVSCSSGSYTGTFSGCTPSACSSAYAQTGFTIGNCGSNTASGTSCTASCASGYSGTPTGAVSCSSGSYSGTFSGCTPSACTSAYTQTGFTIGNCGSNTASGTSCTASCASGYSGTPTGTVSCSGGSYTGTFSGCVAACGTAYTQIGYRLSNCGPNTPSGTTCSASCDSANGYVGTVGGSAACSSGSYTGTFTGCNLATCPAYSQNGYVITGACGGTTTFGTNCSATCAPGYVGTASGRATCGLSGYTGGFSGCVATQSINFASPGPQTIGTSLTLGASATSGLAVSFSSSTPGVCTVSGGTLTFLGIGTCIVSADQAGNQNYAAAQTVTVFLAVSKGTQTITFANPGAQTFGTTRTLTATSSSGLAVTFSSSTSGVCSISAGGALTFLSAGTCTINADQAGNANYSAAQTVAVSFAINQANQTISFDNPGSQYITASPPTVTATSSSGLAVTFSSSTLGVCTVTSGGKVTFVAGGNCTIKADQAGNAGYAAAPTVTQTFQVIDACAATTPCQNGGTCVPAGATYSCLCVARFSGRNCQLLNCSAGTAPSTVPGVCSPCPQGQFSASGASCTPCPVNTFASIFGSSVCLQCPTGTTTAAEGGASLCSSVTTQLNCPSSATPGSAFRVTAVPGSLGSSQVAVSLNISTLDVCTGDIAFGPLDFGLKTLKAGDCVITATPSANGVTGTPATCTVKVGATVTVTTSGSGSVKSDPAGIDCGTTCTASVGSNIALTATPLALTDNVVVSWDGACLGNATAVCKLAPDRDLQVSAAFGVVTGASSAGTPTPVWIASLYQNLLGRTPSSGEIAFWAGQVASMRKSGLSASIPALFLTAFMNSSEYANQRSTDRAFVMNLYEGLLGRRPNQIDTAEPNPWTNNLRAGVPRSALLGAFSASSEASAFAQGPLAFNAAELQQIEYLADLFRVTRASLPDTDIFPALVKNLQGAVCRGDVATVAGALAKAMFSGAEYAARNRTDSEFVYDLYDLLFKRVPDSSEVFGWVSALANEVTRASVLDQFVASAEFGTAVTKPIAAEPCTREEAKYVTRLYQTALARAVDDSGATFFLKPLQSGQCTSSIARQFAGAPATSNDLLNLLSQFQFQSGLTDPVVTAAQSAPSSIFTSAEYASRHRSNSDFVTDLYQSLLKRAPDNSGLTFFAGQINNGVPQLTVVRQIATSTEFLRSSVAPMMVQGCVTPCASAYSQTGYVITGACTLPYSLSGTTCTATCATGYTGTASGTVSCGTNGAYSGLFAGCLPSS